ncbi:amino acid transporter [Alkalinema sp. FACHB-956]|uniref:nucleotidyltransferase domain-containing protein n=1 Tax=Alkalinema sp. FACHB-956 TaxID=2692768 RepID=UPI001688A7CF|nr:amino acid transporter [Alkalinema sp. FACHB-956]MBD2329131.1 amino acid transporter [Alkalinema sp. FACHB-956]
MKSEDVLQIVTWLERAGISVWLDGGWGVDALVGQQTRSHSDLDLVVRLEDANHIEQTLAIYHFAVMLNELPTRFVMKDDNGRSVDFHTVQQGSSGQFIQVLQDGTPFYYPQNSLAGQGMIDGNVISCITPETQMLCHTGYKPQAKDIHDIQLLQQYFNLPLPEEYVGVMTDSE